LKNKGTYEVYVDGSFFNDSVSYAAVILKDGALLKTIKGVVKEEDFISSRQVGGELMAVMKALEWCKENKITSITLYYDYIGIKAWVTGEWKAKKPLTRFYADHVKKSGIKIYWKKVKSHSGNYWNDYVDKLAKRSALEV